MRLLEQADSVLELVRQAGDREVEKMRGKGSWHKPRALEYEYDLLLPGADMELWGDALHVSVVVVAEVSYNTVQILHADWGRH